MHIKMLRRQLFPKITLAIGAIFVIALIGSIAPTVLAVEEQVVDTTTESSNKLRGVTSSIVSLRDDEDDTTNVVRVIGSTVRKTLSISELRQRPVMTNEDVLRHHHQQQRWNNDRDLQQECTDMPGWHDSGGPAFHCKWYEWKPNDDADTNHCEFWGDYPGEQGLTAWQACCTCGGGIMPAALANGPPGLSGNSKGNNKTVPVVVTQPPSQTQPTGVFGAGNPLYQNLDDSYHSALDPQEALSAFNNYRKERNSKAKDLEWDDYLSKGCQAWSDSLVFDGITCKLRGTLHDPNLPACTAEGTFAHGGSIEGLVKELTENLDGNGNVQGHGKVIVDEITTKVGCGCRQVPGQPCLIYVCRYRWTGCP